MFKRYLIAPAIALVGLMGFLSVQSYASTSEMRENAKYLSFDHTVPPEGIKPYMREKGYFIIEETASPHCGGSKRFCANYGEWSFTFENQTYEKFTVYYAGKLTFKGCQISVTKISKEINNAKNN